MNLLLLVFALYLGAVRTRRALSKLGQARADSVRAASPAGPAGGAFHLVSLQLVTYNHAPKCPTRDHVFVDLDLSVTLKVNKEQVSKFVFEMGAERLDAYLSFQVEESIRGLVYDVTHDRVNDMRGEFAEDMLAVLQTKVERFGVDIKAVKITNVALPNILQERRHPRRNQTARRSLLNG